MGLITSFLNGVANLMNETDFEVKIEEAVKNKDSQTVVFVNVCRIDDAKLSQYAIDTALNDNSPVFIKSDQGQAILVKADANNHVETSIVPPYKGEYIFVCDYNANRADVQCEHYSYTRDPRIISNDIFAYKYYEKERILCCTVKTDIVDAFKKLLTKNN